MDKIQLRGECERDEEFAAATATTADGDCERAKSTTFWPTLLTALVDCEFELDNPIEWELLRPKFVLPTTNVTLSVIDLSVATASSCVTFSRLRSPCVCASACVRLCFHSISIFVHHMVARVKKDKKHTNVRAKHGKKRRRKIT